MVRTMKYIDITLEVLLNSLILSFVGAMIRILFTKIDRYQDTIRIFIGSILFGILIGYILNDFEILKRWLKVIIVIFSIFGKELFLWLETIFSDPGKNIGVIMTIVKAFQSINVSFTKKDKKDDVI